MTNQRLLILCTGNFPFGYGEAFLESEIDYIASTFDHIFILPDYKCKRVRSIPANVTIVESEYSDISVIQVFKIILSHPLILKEFAFNFFRNPFRNWELLSLLRKALSKKKDISRIIETKSSAQLYYYSYWLDHSSLALSLLKPKGTLVSRVHNWDVYEERHKYEYLPLRKFIINHLTAVYCISQDALKYLSNKYKVGNKLLLSRLGTNANSDQITSTKEFDTMLSISNLSRIKRVYLIGEIYLINFRQRIAWRHLGFGDDINEYEARYGSENFYGQLSNNDVHKKLQEYQHTSFLINLSSFEGIPVSMMEAMSYGIPCIGTDVGGVAEIIEDGVNGYLLSADPTHDEITHAINELLNLNKSQANSMRKNARQTWEEKFNAHSNFSTFTEAFVALNP